jgi:hypothetical protein
VACAGWPASWAPATGSGGWCNAIGADDASSAEMRQPPRRRLGADPLTLDDRSVDRLLTGTLRAANAPPGYARVGELLAATVAPPTPRELAGQEAVLAELRAATRARAPATTRAAGPRRRRRRAGLAVVVVAGALATGGAAAAATGHLPEPVRQAARSVLTVTGGGPATPTAPSPGAGTAGSGGVGPAAAPPAGTPARGPGSAAVGSAAQPDLEGLCQAYLAGKGGEQGGKLDATAFKALSEAAGGDDRLPAFCQRLQPADARQQEPGKPRRQDPPGEDQGQPGLPADPHGNDGAGRPR